VLQQNLGGHKVNEDREVKTDKMVDKAGHRLLLTGG